MIIHASLPVIVRAVCAALRRAPCHRAAIADLASAACLHHPCSFTIRIREEGAPEEGVRIHRAFVGPVMISRSGRHILSHLNLFRPLSPGPPPISCNNNFLAGTRQCPVVDSDPRSICSVFFSRADYMLRHVLVICQNR